jgi:hypothetical protein
MACDDPLPEKFIKIAIRMDEVHINASKKIEKKN